MEQVLHDVQVPHEGCYMKRSQTRLMGERNRGHMKREES
jgi:hypothetical protein